MSEIMDISGKMVDLGGRGLVYDSRTVILYLDHLGVILFPFFSLNFFMYKV